MRLKKNIILTTQFYILKGEAMMVYQLLNMSDTKYLRFAAKSGASSSIISSHVKLGEIGENFGDWYSELYETYKSNIGISWWYHIKYPLIRLFR